MNISTWLCVTRRLFSVSFYRLQTQQSFTAVYASMSACVPLEAAAGEECSVGEKQDRVSPSQWVQYSIPFSQVLLSDSFSSHLPSFVPEGIKKGTTSLPACFPVKFQSVSVGDLAWIVFLSMFGFFFPSSRRMTHFTIWQKSPRCCDLATVNYRRHSNKGKGMYLKKIQKSEWTIISFELPDSIKENSVFSSSSSSPSSMSTREKREAVGHFSKSLSLSVDSR